MKPLPSRPPLWLLSSLLAALGIGWCFALCGGLLLLGALGYMLSSRKITG